MTDARDPGQPFTVNKLLERPPSPRPPSDYNPPPPPVPILPAAPPLPATGAAPPACSLDTPEGFQLLSMLVEPHRKNFLQAEHDLPRQAAIIQMIRNMVKQQYPTMVFTDAQGNQLEQDTLGLAIAKVLWQTKELKTNTQKTNDRQQQQHYQQQQPQNGKEAEATSAGRAGGGGSMGNATDVTFMHDDVQAYQFLANMKRHHHPAATSVAPPPPTGAWTTTTTPASTYMVAGKPYEHLSPTDPSSGLHGINLAAEHLVAAKRKAQVKVKKKTPRPHHHHHGNGVGGGTGGGGTSRRGQENRVTSAYKASALPMRVLENFPTRDELQKLASGLLPKTKNVTDEIPRGVTIRPSGRWQSQVYYKGASRYIGVFSDSREAAVAWIIAKELLSSVTVPDATKEEYNVWFNVVRDVVADLVQGVIVSSSNNPAV